MLFIKKRYWNEEEGEGDHMLQEKEATWEVKPQEETPAVKEEPGENAAARALMELGQHPLMLLKPPPQGIAPSRTLCVPSSLQIAKYWVKVAAGRISKDSEINRIAVHYDCQFFEAPGGNNWRCIKCATKEKREGWIFKNRHCWALRHCWLEQHAQASVTSTWGA